MSTLPRLAKYGAGVAAGVAYNLESKAREYAMEKYPPQIPPVKPTDDSREVFGFFGCPRDVVPRIEEHARNLWFVPVESRMADLRWKRTGDPHPTVQSFAKSRTWRSMWLEGPPVVAQLEVRKGEKIMESDLWVDPQLNNPTAASQFVIIPPSVSLYPAIPPNVQRRADLTARVYYDVNIDTRLDAIGAYGRMFKALTKS